MNANYGALRHFAQAFSRLLVFSGASFPYLTKQTIHEKVAESRDCDFFLDFVLHTRDIQAVMSRNYDILTPRQTACLSTINALSRLSRPPSLEEIGRSLNVKKASAQGLVGALVRKGYLRRQSGSYRSTQLTPKALAALGEKTPTLTT